MIRPVHTDEAVHSIKFKGLWEDGKYRYDPDEYHGPTLYYATLPLWPVGERGGSIRGLERIDTAVGAGVVWCGVGALVGLDAGRTGAWGKFCGRGC
jgi:predicted membrane-bound mannosyltransferase